MGDKVLFRYGEAAVLLGRTGYNAVKVAVSKGQIQNFKKQGYKRSTFIHRDEIVRLLSEFHTLSEIELILKNFKMPPAAMPSETTGNHQKPQSGHSPKVAA